MTTTKKSKSYQKIVILAIILVMPGFLFYFLNQKAENRYQSLPILGPKQLSGTFHSKRGVQIPDTLFHHVQSFTLTDVTGKEVPYPADQESISVVNFFYTRCVRLCPEVNEGMSRLAHIFGKNEIIKFYSLSVDSTDSSELLASYAQTYGTENTYWKFLGSNQKDKVIGLSRNEFLLDAILDTSRADSYILSPKLVLLDSKQRIRGYYDGSQPKQMDLLIDEIKLLVTEELRNRKYY